MGRRAGWLAAVLLLLAGAWKLGAVPSAPPFPGQARAGASPARSRKALPPAQQQETALKLQVSSKSFPAGADIPKKYTCDGQNISPELAWANLPGDTRSVAVLLEDPDAPGGTFTHWLMYDLPVGMASVVEGVPVTGEIPGGGLQGINDFGKLGYGGPCPPPGRAHRYVFRVFALDKILGLPSRASKESVQQAMRGHVLAEGEIVGKFGH